MLEQPKGVEGREQAMVQFPGGYIAGIYSRSSRKGAQAAKEFASRLSWHRGRASRNAEKGPITHDDLKIWAAAWSSHNVSTAMSLFSKDVVINQPANPKPLNFSSARQFFGMIFKAYPDFHVTLIKPIVDGYDAVSVEEVTGTWTGTYTDPATGKSTRGNGRHFDHPGAMVIHYTKDHKIDRVSIFWDQLTVDRQLGIKP